MDRLTDHLYRDQKARALYAQAVELDPKFAMAYAMLAWTSAFETMNGVSSDRDASPCQAIALDDALPVAHFVTGLVYRERRECIKARTEAESEDIVFARLIAPCSSRGGPLWCLVASRHTAATDVRLRCLPMRSASLFRTL